MTSYTPTSPALWGQSPTQRWAAEVSEAGEWAARWLAVLALWSVRLAWLLLRRLRWGSGETIVCTVVFGLWVAMLARTYPLVHWPTAEEAATDLEQISAVLGGTFLALAGLHMQLEERGGGGGGLRAYLPSPEQTKTWRWSTSLHEAGHLVVGQALHRVTGKAWLLPNGGGRTRVYPKKNDIVGEIAINKAGARACGSTEGAGGDEAATAALLEKIPARLRRQTEAAGDRLCNRLCNEQRSKILRKAREIYDRGYTY